MTRRHLSLTPRLLAIAERIPQNAKVVDIGTDHARLPVYLCEQNITRTIIAADVKNGPLQRAKRTLEKHQLVDIVELRQCDGGKGLSPLEVDAAVIAGMGGDTIAEILLSSPWLVTKLCLLQPMTHPERVYEALDTLQCTVTEELQICEANRLYTLIVTGGEQNDNSTQYYRGDGEAGTL